MKQCSIEDCNNIHLANNYCTKHYYRFKRHGDPNIKFSPKPKRFCSVEGCNNIYHSRGYCSLHYNKMIIRNNPPCNVEGCDQPRVGKGFCQKHYRRNRFNGDPNKTQININPPKICIVDGCNKPFRADGMCQSHYMNEYNTKRRKIVISHYTDGSMKCTCCGENIYKFLTIDHINNNGSDDRSNGIFSGHGLINYLIKNNFPEGFTVLCYNCNCGRATNNGKCPHKSSSLYI